MTACKTGSFSLFLLLIFSECVNVSATDLFACAARAVVSKRAEGSDSSFRRISVEKSMQNVDGRDLRPLTSSPLTHRFTQKHTHMQWVKTALL